jgi:PBP1b-binding outer membrane lipoprotein LpoB
MYRNKYKLVKLTIIIFSTILLIGCSSLKPQPQCKLPLPPIQSVQPLPELNDI